MINSVNAYDFPDNGMFLCAALRFLQFTKATGF